MDIDPLELVKPGDDDNPENTTPSQEDSGASPQDTIALKKEKSKNFCPITPPSS